MDIEKDPQKEQNSTETELRARVEELETILDHIPMSLYWKDRDMVYRGANDEFGKMIPLPSVVGKTDFDFHVKEAAEKFRGEDLQFLNGEKTETYFTDRKVPFEEDFIWARTYKIPIYDEAHKIKYIMGLIQDVTKIKEAEEIIVRQRDQLEVAVKEAVDASKSKSDFLSRMSHEIRTPLNAIIGMSKIAGGTEDIVKIKDCLQKIDSSSKHLLGIINDVLDMSKIEANKLVLSVEVFRFENMLMDVVNVVSSLANEKRQNFQVFLDQTMPEYYNGDAMRLRQVITNLISNAVKFTPEKGEIDLRVKFLGEESGIANIEITVSDTGIGVSEEQKNKLFQPFEQADGSISRKFGGTGLGLIISKTIVEMMGGNIHIESELGSGSSFIFNVKLEVVEEHAEDRLPTINFSDMRVLVVDDSQETLDYMSQVLAKLGLQADVAKDGYEAIEKIEASDKRNEPYNIFFVDWAMPGMDGIETTRKLKLMTEDKTIVIMISGTAWSEIEEDAKDAGVDRYMPKPLFPSMVQTALTEISESGTRHVIHSGEKDIPNLEGQCFLLAEDIEINREIALALLEPTKVELEFAENGREAVEKFNADKEKYSLILMDLHMPEMDGYEATRQIRADSDLKSRTVPIVAMTADAFKEDIDKCKDAGMDDHISKPINEKELYKKVLLCFRK